MKKLIALTALLVLSACEPPPAETPVKRPATQVPPLFKQDTKAAADSTIGMIPADATPIKVGLLLPLTGDSAALGNSMLDAATLALYDEYMSVPSGEIHSQIILVPRDTGNSANSSAMAAEQLIKDGATFIVGPLFSQAVTAMKPIVKAAHVPVISFSNNRTAAEPNIYTYGYMPEQQISRIAEYAYLRGYQRVGLLAPNDAYGQKVRDELSFIYTQKGGFVSPSELYAPSEANIDAAVSRLMAGYENNTEDRKFQAIFIADGGSNVKNIIKSLKRHNLDFNKIKLLGAGLWDDQDLGKIPEMNGAIFPGTPPEYARNFERRFIAMYGYKPSRLASLSYDIVSLLAKLSMSSDAAKINPGLLLDRDGFNAPANGLYRLLPDGTSERKLAILQVTPTGFKVLEPASKSFSIIGE